MSETEGPEQSGLFHLLQLASLPNAAAQLDQAKLSTLGEKCVKEFEEDNASRKDWLKRSEEAMEAALQSAEKKTFPWEDAANVKYPLLTVAALQFHARAYPAICGDKITKGKVTGADPEGLKSQKAKNISDHMNYQFAEEMPEWEEEMDKILLALPIEGCEFKKTYFDPSKGRNVSHWIRPKDFVVSNETRSLADCPRMTHVFPLYPHQLKERMRQGTYLEKDILDTDDDEKEVPQTIIEQHRLEDLNGDGIKEPWIVTVHKEKREVLRIRSGFEPDGITVEIQGKTLPITQVPPELLPSCKLVSIKREEYFTKYSFFPSPDGGFYDVGFGQLIGPLSGVVDTLTNQMLDAGLLANMPSGFYTKGVKMPKGDVGFRPGEFKPVDVSTGAVLRDGIYQFQFGGPSPVQFSLLDMLLKAVQDITAVKDILTGETGGSNQPVGTTLAAIEQGLKVFGSIYKRIYRALTAELKKLYRLNTLYLPPESYYRILDTGEGATIQQTDYQGDGTDVQPVADPTAATTMQEMARAQVGMQMAEAGNPHINIGEATKVFLEAAKLPVARLFIPEPPQQQNPEIEAKAQKTLAEAQKVLAEAEKVKAEITKLAADTIKSLAEAEATEAGIQIQAYNAQREALDAQRGMGGLEDPPPDSGGIPQDEGIPTEILGGVDPLLGYEQPGEDPGIDGALPGEGGGY